MRIGELSSRTRIPIRMLRYYEERGLLTPQRTPSGYRHYEEADVERATLVSSLIRSGLPTRLILPLLRDEQPNPAARDETDDEEDELVALFTAELARLDSRIKCMSLSRDAVRRHLRRLRTTRVNRASEAAGDARNDPNPACGHRSAVRSEDVIARG